MVIYGNNMSARPVQTDPGNQFVLVPTGEKWVFADEGLWRPMPISPIDPENFIKTTDYATNVKPGIVSVGAGLSVTAQGVLSATPELPPVTADDNGKILKVVDGVWTAVAPE